MNTRTGLAALAAAAALGAGALATGGAGGAPGTSLTLTAKPTGANQLDLGRHGVSVGDQFFEHGSLADASGKAAGHFQIAGQLVSGNARRGSEQTTMTLFVAGGTLEIAGGHAAVEGGYALSVVGGTGSYAGARGTLTVSPGSRGSQRLAVALRG